MDLVAHGCRPVELLNRHKVPCIISLNVRKNLFFSCNYQAYPSSGTDDWIKGPVST